MQISNCAISIRTVMRGQGRRSSILPTPGSFQATARLVSMLRRYGARGRARSSADWLEGAMGVAEVIPAQRVDESGYKEAPGIRGRSYPLGATPIKNGVNFSVYARDATGV